MQTVELLEQHYGAGVLPVEPNQKFEELRKQYLENPEDFRRLAAEGLDKTYWVTEKILESDLEGSKIELHQSSPITTVTIPEENATRLMGKLGRGEFEALTIGKYHFKENSPFYGTYAILLTNDKPLLEIAKKHEEFHVRYRESSRPRNDAYSLSCEADGEKHCEAQSLIAEMDLLVEALGCGIPEEDKLHLKTVLNRHYVPVSAQYVADVFDDSGVLPDSGIVSRSAAKTVVEKAATGYFEDVVDSGVDACMVLNGNLPEEKVERIVMTCGPSKEEVLSGKVYVRPAKELELWSKHYREVLATVESVQR